MTLTQILVFTAAAALCGISSRQSWRNWFLLAGSTAAVYWMQPATPIRYLDFWLPTASLALAVLIWAATHPNGARGWRSNLPAALVVTGIVSAIAITRYLGPVCCLTPTRPPAFLQVLLALGAVALAAAALLRFLPTNLRVVGFSSVLILGLFILLKTEPLSAWASAGLRSLAGQSAASASSFDIRWLGFSYIAFRLLHTLRDRLAGKLPELTLAEFITFIVFFATYTAGPIDRVQRFIGDLRRTGPPTVDDLAAGAGKILVGLFKKFVLADSLALFALSGSNADQVQSTGWMWILLYAFALRLYFDFSGLTDVAIGLGRLVGFRLPPNFDRPYLKPNLTTFWNSWHMTLAQWFRAYFFNPVTRSLRGGKRKLSLPLIIFTGQVGTMLLIGLWHGVTWNFLLWGLWHGIGLFIHNRWSEAMRPRLAFVEGHTWAKRASTSLGTLFTFHYVTLGWVWFALPTPQMGWDSLRLLFGG